MNVFSLFADLKLDDKQYNRSLDRAEGKTNATLRRLQTNFDTLGRRLQTIGGSLTRSLTVPIAAAGTAAFVAAGKFSNLADQVDKGRQSAGLSAERYQTLKFAFDQSGISAEQFDLSLNSLNRRLGLAAQGNVTYAKAYEQLGVSVRDANGNVRSTNDVFDDLIARLAEMPSAAEQAATASIVFGDDVGKKLVPVLSQGTAGLEELEQRAHDLGLVMSGPAVDSLVGYKDDMAALRQQLSTAGVEITATLVPALRAFVEFTRNSVVPWMQSMADRVAGLVEWWGEASEGTRTFIKVVVGGLAAAGPATLAIGTASRAVSGLIGLVRTLRTLMLTAAGPAGWITLIAAAVGVTLVTAWRKHDDAIDDAIEQTDKIRDAIGQAGDKTALRGVVTDLAADLKDPGRREFVKYAEQALASAGDVTEAADMIVQAHARIKNSGEISRIERQIEQRRREIDALEDTVGAFSSGTQGLVDELDRLERISRERELTYDEVNRVMLLQSQLERGDIVRDSDVEEAEARLQGMRDELRGLQGTLRELQGLSPTDVTVRPEVQVTVVPDADVDDATPENPTGLPGDGEEREVTIWTRRAGGTFLTPAEEAYAAFLLGRGAGGASQATGRFAPREGFGPGVRPPLVQEPGRSNRRPAPGAPSFGGREGFGPIPVTLVEEPGQSNRRPILVFGPREGFGSGARPPLVEEPGRSNRRPAPTFAPREGFGPLYPGGPLVEEPGRSRRTGPMGEREGFGRVPGAGRVGLVEEPGGRFQQGAPAERGPTFLEKLGEGASALGSELLNLAEQHVPLVGTAIQGFAQGPIAGVAAIFSELLGSSEAWADVQEIFTEILIKAAEALEPLIAAVLKLLDALWPIIAVAIELIEVALKPLTFIISEILAPVITFVARVIAAIWNFFARIFGMDTVDIDGSAPRKPADPKTSPDTGTRSGSSRGPETNFGGTPQAVQLAVATPLVDAAYTMQEAVNALLRSLPTMTGTGPDSFAGAFGAHIETFGGYVNRLVTEGIRIQVGQGTGGRGGSSTAHLRTI